MLGLEYQLAMEPMARIHTYNVLKLEEMQFIMRQGQWHVLLRSKTFCQS
jgi:hypothetical protein